MTLRTSFRYFLRSMVFPGLDLHTRSRGVLCRYWRDGPRDVLDAGFGNGYFAYLAYKTGARVVAVSNDAQQVSKSNEYFLQYKKLDPERISFEHWNLHKLETETRSFDEILCYETLEHIREEQKIVSQFYRILRPGGSLHLCCPFALHPRHKREELDLQERGGHVRSGYTEEDYQSLLTPPGFILGPVKGIGNSYVYRADAFLRYLRRTVGDVAALPVFFLLRPGLALAASEPRIPFSVYVQATKPERV